MILITTYDDLKSFLVAFGKGHFDLLIVISRGGLGKTYNAQKILGHNVRKINCHATPLGLYEEGYRHKDRNVWFDDVENMFNNDKLIGLLKQFCETQPEKDIQYNTSWNLEKTRKIPKSYTTRSKVLMMVNTIQRKENSGILALLDRGITLSFEPSKEEIKNYIRTCFKKIDEEVLGYASMNDEFSIRDYIKLKQLKEAGFKNWRDMTKNKRMHNELAEEPTDTDSEREDMIKNYKNVKKELGKDYVTEREMDSQYINNKSKYQTYNYRRKFGSWLDFVKEMGEERIHHFYSGPTKDHLSEKSKDIPNKLKRCITADDKKKKKQRVIQNVLTFLKNNKDTDFSVAKIVSQSGVSDTTLRRFWKDMEDNDMITKTRGIGNARLYKINMENDFVKQLGSKKDLEMTTEQDQYMIAIYEILELWGANNLPISTRDIAKRSSTPWNIAKEKLLMLEREDIVKRIPGKIRKFKRRFKRQGIIEQRDIISDSKVEWILMKYTKNEGLQSAKIA